MSIFLELNLSNNQILKELDLRQSDTQYMTTKLREGIAIKKPEARSKGDIKHNPMRLKKRAKSKKK
ncbi:MAG: hypothetical protein ABF289_20590 [Clostridiales bacterium]